MADQAVVPSALFCCDGSDASGATAADLSGIRVVATDMDGTFLAPDHKAPEENLAALREAEAAGLAMVFCTGRNRASAQSRVKNLDLGKRLGIYLNGAVVYGRIGAVIHERTVGRDVVVDVLRLVQERDRSCFSVVLCNGDDHAVPDTQDRWALHLHRKYEDPSPSSLGGYEAAIARFSGKGNGETVEEPSQKKSRCREPHVLHVLGGSDDLDSIRKALEKCCAGRVKVVRALPTCLTLLHPLCNKADGLQVALTELGSTMRETLALGDAENDIEMLQAVKIGVAMGNAMPKVKEAAKWCCAGNHAEPPGVCRVLRELLAVASSARGGLREHQGEQK